MRDIVIQSTFQKERRSPPSFRSSGETIAFPTEGKYVIVLAKCGDRSCCKAPRLPQPLFKQFTDIGWVYPVQSDDPEHYMKFVDAFDNRESRQENCLPAAVSTKKKHPFSLVQGRARAVIFVL